MPLSTALQLLALVIWGFLVQLVMLNRADGADFWITSTEFSLRVQNGMNVESRGLGLAGQFTKSLNEFLLDIVREIVLFPEEYDTTLRDWFVSAHVLIRR